MIFKHRQPVITTIYFNLKGGRYQTSSKSYKASMNLIARNNSAASVIGPGELTIWSEEDEV